MHQIEIRNCNNINYGKIVLEKNKLNIKYGINGTGKTTLSRAINYSKNSDGLQELRSYMSDDPAEIKVTPELSKVLIFDENFVNQVVFKEDEVIENSFEIFLKTANYDAKKEQLDQHLKNLKTIMDDDSEIIELKNNLVRINDKFKRTASGKISKTGAMKSLLSKQNLYKIPKELEDYKPFLENMDINIPWIDWKNKGDNYDIGDNCPYCSIKVDVKKHNEKKEIFKTTYKKADAQNLKDVLELLETLQQYIEKNKYNDLVTYVKTDTPEDIINTIVEKLTTELDLLISRFNAINEFGDKKIAIADISSLDKQIENMEIPKSLFEFFGGEKINNIFNKLNDSILQLKKEIAVLKKEMGELKGIIQGTITASQNDINEFLKKAGINYELEIRVEDETNSRTILKQCFGKDKTDVTNIRQHLSWGEKNAFSLILFMYYSQTQNPNLIILDDPISSFDSNKKYAILHRMFKNVGKRDVSLRGKTVLLLTHDFEPITDFIIVGKLNTDDATAAFIWNENGQLKENIIDAESDVKLITNECEDIAKDVGVNIVSRIAFLRKLCELYNCRGSWNEAYEILSCLIHGSDIRRKISKDNYIEMSTEEISRGLIRIKQYIVDFDYEKLRNEIYNIEGIKSIYNIEGNAYFKVQLFREICEIDNNDKLKISSLDQGWYKFIDETYHIENDYLHYLDVSKFNIVPSYILEKIDEMVETL